MLRIDKVQQIEGVTVYGDDAKFNVFYLLPQQPRYRLNPDGTPAFRFLKYRFAVDRPGGKKGGGFLLFDAEFVVDESKKPSILEVLASQVRQEANRRNIDPAPEVQLGSITYTKGETKLFVAGSDGTFVEKLNNPGKPSLYGNNVTAFALELSEEGATFFEQAMQGAGGAASIIYDLWFWTKLPAVRIDARFNARKFYEFYQTIDTEWHLWAEDEYRETIREQMISSESMSINFDWGGLTDEKIRTQLRDWAFRTLEDATERNMIEAIAPVPDDQRKKPDGIEDVTRDITSEKISSFSLHFREAQSVEWNLAPQGMLQNITELTDKDGNKLNWNDFSDIVDLDDPLFRQLRVNVKVNADFSALPIHSVEVKLIYNGRPMPNLDPDQPEGETVLMSPDDLGKFATFVENDDWNYTYSYQINYRGQSRIYQSPDIETNEGNLTVGVDDIGILTVDVSAGDLDWNDIESALVTFRYEDSSAGVELIEDQFRLNQSAQTHQIQEVIFAPMRKNYTYRIKYFMKNGKEYTGDEIESRAQNLFINDVFAGRKTIGVRGIGDFQTKIQTVFLDLKYIDEENDYIQTKSQALTADVLNFEWNFPVISETGGTVTYSGTISYNDGTSEEIPETIANTNTILVGELVEDILKVEIFTDLVDWTTVRLARVSFRYEDPDNDVSEKKDFIFSPTKNDPQTWEVKLKDKDQSQYSYTVMYFMTDGTRKTVGPTTSGELSLILDPLQ